MKKKYSVGSFFVVPRQWITITLTNKYQAHLYLWAEPLLNIKIYLKFPVDSIN